MKLAIFSIGYLDLCLLTMSYIEKCVKMPKGRYFLQFVLLGVISMGMFPFYRIAAEPATRYITNISFLVLCAIVLTRFLVKNDKPVTKANMILALNVLASAFSVVLFFQTYCMIARQQHKYTPSFYFFIRYFNHYVISLVLLVAGLIVSGAALGGNLFTMIYDKRTPSRSTGGVVKLTAWVVIVILIALSAYFIRNLMPPNSGIIYGGIFVLSVFLGVIISHIFNVFKFLRKAYFLTAMMALAIILSGVLISSPALTYTGSLLIFFSLLMALTFNIRAKNVYY